MSISTSGITCDLHLLQLGIVSLHRLSKPNRRRLPIHRDEIRIEHLHEPFVCCSRSVPRKLSILEEDGGKVPALQFAQAAEKDAYFVDARGVGDEDRVVGGGEEELEAVFYEIFGEGGRGGGGG